MTKPNGYLVNGTMYPARTDACEKAMLEYIQELEAENKAMREAAKAICEAFGTNSGPKMAVLAALLEVSDETFNRA